MTFNHIRDAAEFLLFQERMGKAIDHIARKHLQEMNRRQHFKSRSDGQKRRQEREREERND